MSVQRDVNCCSISDATSLHPRVLRLVGMLTLMVILFLHTYVGVGKSTPKVSRDLEQTELNFNGYFDIFGVQQLHGAIVHHT